MSAETPYIPGYNYGRKYIIMDVKTTEQGTKKFTKEEKLAILKESRETGVKATLEKYALYPATFYYWKNKFDEPGADGLHHSSAKEKLKKLKELEKENRKLKELLTQEKLESALKNDLLKKSIRI
jgi:putative transposase